MLYNELISIIKPFFIERWFNDLSTNETLVNYINMALHTIYNKWPFNFMYEYKKNLKPIKIWVNEWDNNIYEVTYDIYKIRSLKWNGNITLNASIWWITETTDIYFYNNKIETHNSITSITIEYLKEYNNVTYDSLDDNSVIPAPDKFMPVIINYVYAYASAINLMVNEWSAIDYLTLADKLLTDISNSDRMSESIEIKI